MNADEQRLADLLKRVVPDPPRQLTYEEITMPNAERAVKTWLMPALAAASVLIIGGAVGAVAATRSSQSAPGSPTAYQGTGGSATPVAKPTSPGCQATPVPVPTTGRGASVTLPSVIGQSQLAAEATLSQAGLKVVINERASQTIPAGTTILQSPSAGARVAGGSTVTLTISAGPAETKPTATAVPTCLPVAGSATGPSTPVPGGAIPTASPTALPSSAPGGPSVVPTAAAGTTAPSPIATTEASSAVPTAGEVSVPNLIGQSSLAAQNAAQLAGLTVHLQAKSAPAAQSVPQGVVWGQDPAAGTAVAEGAVVTLYGQP